MKIIADPQLNQSEVNDLVAKEIQEWKSMNKEIAAIELSLVGNEVEIQTTEKSPINRVRRITGYLSSVEKFNDAKKAELRDRYVHAG